jgi:hypothetical protein
LIATSLPRIRGAQLASGSVRDPLLPNFGSFSGHQSAGRLCHPWANAVVLLQLDFFFTAQKPKIIRWKNIF